MEIQINSLVQSKQSKVLYKVKEINGVHVTLVPMSDGADVKVHEAVVKSLFVYRGIRQELTTENFTEHVEKYVNSNTMDNKMLWLITGLIEESGELLEILRNKEYKNVDIDRRHLVEEMGDVLYYLTGLMNLFGVTETEVKQGNIDKLKKRFPFGFNIQDAIKKADHE